MKQSWEFESTNGEECAQLRAAFYATINPVWQNVVGAVRRQCREIRAPLLEPWITQRERNYVCYAYMSQEYDTLRVGVVVNNLPSGNYREVLRLVRALGFLPPDRVAV